MECGSSLPLFYTQSYVLKQSTLNDLQPPAGNFMALKGPNMIAWNNAPGARNS